MELKDLHQKHYGSKEMEGKKYDHFHMAIIVIISVLAAIGLYILSISAIFDTENLVISPPDPDIANITLKTDRNSYSVGDVVELDVHLATNRRTAGVDIILTFDPTYLLLVEATPQKNVERPDVNYLAQISDVIFKNFPYAKLEKRGSRMIFSFSAISDPQETFKGGGSIAILRFKTLLAGRTTVEIISDDSIVLDSNVAFEGKDILVEANNAEIIITE